MTGNTKTNLRNEVVREIKNRWNSDYSIRPAGPSKITDSEARAMLRGEASNDQYRFAYNIAREYGLDF